MSIEQIKSLTGALNTIIAFVTLLWAETQKSSEKGE